MNLHYLLLLSLLCQWSYAQKKIKEPRPYPVPTHALLSSIVPGGGQLYNKEIWKWPVILGAGITVAYYINYEQRVFTALRDNILDEAENPEKLDPFSKAVLQNGAEGFRRNRDLLIIIASALYILQGIDAYVSAHLHNFDEKFETPKPNKVSLGLSLVPLPLGQWAYMCQVRWAL